MNQPTRPLNDRDAAIRWGEIHQQEVDWEKIAPKVPMIPLSSVVWPTDKLYGTEHHQRVAVLSTHIARREFPDLPQKEIDAIWCAALFHDLRRENGFGADDRSHRHASASYAREILKLPDSEVHGDETLIERACWLIANHGRWVDDGGIGGSKQIKHTSDPALMCLIDADSMDIVRIAPKTPRGGALIAENLKAEMMLTQYAKQIENIRNWMNFRGWKK